MEIDSDADADGDIDDDPSPPKDHAKDQGNTGKQSSGALSPHNVSRSGPLASKKREEKPQPSELREPTPEERADLQKRL